MMKSKTLTETNQYLKKTDSGKMMARNLASSTAVETGKDASIYVDRYNAIHSRKPAAK